MRTIAIIQARMGSTRLPGKVLRSICPDMEVPGVYCPVRLAVNACRSARNVDDVWVATSTHAADDVIERSFKGGTKVYRGSEVDVLSRFMECADAAGADIILRLTADCPFLDPSVIEQVVELRKRTAADYASCIDPPTWPDGLDVECFTRRALEEAHREATRPSDRDCVTRFMVRNRSRFKAVNLTCPLPGLEKERWVLDAQDDYEFCVELAKHISQWPPSYIDILNILDENPELRKLNKNHTRNERFFDGISTEKMAPRSYKRSQVCLTRAERHIPLGAQTFSKSKLQFPDGSPLFLSHGDGAYVYDVDGNDYVDLVSALLPNILGYRDHDVDRAVRNQLDSGASLSLATELEADLAERLHQHIPCAEMTRFGKTGSDVTTAAIRLARHHTGRAYIIAMGYHGWHDWSIGRDGIRSHGVPGAINALTHKADYGDKEWVSDVLKTRSVAAIIAEPETDQDYLKWLRYECDFYGTVLIFDEVITGFRWSMGGAQKHFGVTPDLACFGKAMGNGMPISALVGKRHIMKKMAPPDNIFYSGTFFGETLSLAAACATIDKLQREKVIDYLWIEADNLATNISNIMSKHKMGDKIMIANNPPLYRLLFKNRAIQDIFTRAMADAGVLIINSNNLTWAHKAPQIGRIMSAYDHACEKVAEAIKDGKLAA